MIPERSARENTMPEKSAAEQIDELKKKLDAAERENNKLQSKLSDAQNELQSLQNYQDTMNSKIKQIEIFRNKKKGIKLNEALIELIELNGEHYGR